MITPFYNFDKTIIEKAEKAEKICKEKFDELDVIRHYNSQKVLRAFSDNMISESHLLGTTGYGYGDRGRDSLDNVVSQCFGCEDALVRHNFVSGTHALSTALFGILRPGDTMLSITGQPYDTLLEVIGISGSGNGSLRDFGINYSQIDLLEDGSVDIEKVVNMCKGVKMVYLQRSRGYSLRDSLSIDKMKEIFEKVRGVNDSVCIVVDNCYGEFVEITEPTQIGADVIIGSLIKNPGGAIAETGGYIAGKRKYIELCAYRLTTVGTGKEVGASLGQNKSMYMGFFLSPNVVMEAVKTSVFASAFFELLGYDVFPKFSDHRTDIIQGIKLGNKEKLVAFCEGIQKGAPIDSFVVPEPWDMPGYSDPVIMAAGAFNMGASIELSADAPLRDPFAVWLQGGITYPTGRTGIMLAAQSMKEKNML